MVSEIATQKQIHDEVKVHLVLKGVVHVDDKVTGNHGQKLKLVHHAWYTFLRDDSCFGHPCCWWTSWLEVETIGRLGTPLIGNRKLTGFELPRLHFKRHRSERLSKIPVLAEVPADVEQVVEHDTNHPVSRELYDVEKLVLGDFFVFRSGIERFSKGDPLDAELPREPMPSLYSEVDSLFQVQVVCTSHGISSRAPLNSSWR